MAGDRGLFAAVVALAAGALALLAWPLATGTLVTTGDLGDWTIPTRWFYARALAGGDSAAWFPHVLCGVDLHGEGQAGLAHPLHWLVYRFAPLTLAINLELAWPYPALLAGLFLLLRTHGVDRGPALFGGFAFAFGGFCMRHYQHVNGVEVIAHFPWALLAIHAALCGSTARRRALGGLGLALATASALLLGYPQYFWLGAIAEAGYVVVLLRERPGLARLALVGAFKTLGVLGGAVQLLPTFAALALSVREATTTAYRYEFPVHPVELLGLVAPRVLEHADKMYPPRPYPGVVSVVLAVWLVVRPRDARLPLARAAWVLAIPCALLMLGQYGLLYELHLRLPVVGTFRSPYRFAVLVELAMAVLAACALHDLGRRGAPVPWRRAAAVFAVPAAGVLAVVAIQVLRTNGTSQYVTKLASTAPVALAGLALAATAALAVALAARGKRVGLLACAVLAAIDLGTYGFAHVYREPPVRLDDYVALVPEPPPHEPGERVIAAVANQLALRDVRTVDGYMQLRQARAFDAELDEHGVRSEPHLRLATVRWVQREPTDNWRIKSRNRELLRAQAREWDEVPNPLPRARLVGESVRTDDPDAVTLEVDVARVAVVEAAIPVRPGEGSARLVVDRPGAIDVEVESATPQLLVVAESWHPGWVATVDGAERDVVRAYGMFLAVLVEPGDRRVALRFAPRATSLGAWLSLIGLAGAILLAASCARGRRESAPAAG